MFDYVCDDIGLNHQKVFQYHQIQQKRKLVKIRELDKRYMTENYKPAKCTMENCSRNATHWLTRQNSEYCQSDMVCSFHSEIWMEVKSLIAQN